MDNKLTPISEILGNDDAINDIINDISKRDINDIAIVLRQKDGKILTQWIGDLLSLSKLSEILTDQIDDVIYNSGECSES